jgi:uncharacterized protein YjbI with pentapeptide repeats
MPNELHLKKILQGVSAWNDWRLQLTGKPDLSEVYLAGLNLDNADLSWADLSGADLHGATLRGGNLSGADLTEANLTLADLRRADLSGASFRMTHLGGARLEGANLSRANLNEARLPTATLEGANLSEASLTRADVSDANLSHARIIRGQLGGTDLKRARLAHADLSFAYLSEADLRQAQLNGADFRRALLVGADFSESELSGADLSGAMLARSNFGNTDLSKVKGLESVIHRGPSTIGIDTLFKSDGKIPEMFLRGAGVPDDFITFAPSLVGRAIEFYSCFISYSHEDEEFSRRLYSQMRSENLRVWYAPEDMKGGKKLHEEIFQAIQIHDKLLLVLSASSMKSEWVTTEIRRARRVESEENRRKLFPIRLVDFEAIQKWECFDADAKKDLAIEVREYYIPDFTNWKDHDAFEAEFRKLLRDLRAETP